MKIDIPSASALIGILIGIGYISKYLEETIRDNVREEFVFWLKRTGNRSFSDGLSACNILFLNIFDHIFLKGPSAYSGYLWLWIAGMFVSSVTLNLYYRLVGLDPVNLQHILLQGALIGCVFAVIPYVPYAEILRENILGKKTKKINVSLPMRSVLIRYFLVISGGLLVGVVIPKGAVPFWELSIIWGGYFMLLSFIAVVVFVCCYISFKNFSPFRAIMMSLIVMLLIGLFKSDMVQSLLLDINQFGWSILGYLLLNVCVDSFSLLETRYIITLTSRGTFIRFLVVVILDILASATIFLAIPILSGNLHVFIEAISFQGNHPWIGILFWSSFSTSIFFYLYLASAGVLAISCAVVKGIHSLNRFLPIWEKPFRCLGLVAMMITMFSFLILLFLF